MSTVVEEVKEVQSPNGVKVDSPAEKRPVPAFPFAAAPFAAVAASMVAVRLLRRRREAPKPSVYWSLSLVSGNHVTFRPTLAPRLAGFFVPGRRGRQAGRRLFKR